MTALRFQTGPPFGAQHLQRCTLPFDQKGVKGSLISFYHLNWCFCCIFSFQTTLLTNKVFFSTKCKLAPWEPNLIWTRCDEQKAPVTMILHRFKSVELTDGILHILIPNQPTNPTNKNNKHTVDWHSKVRKITLKYFSNSCDLEHGSRSLKPRWTHVKLNEENHAVSRSLINSIGNHITVFAKSRQAAIISHEYTPVMNNIECMNWSIQPPHKVWTQSKQIRTLIAKKIHLSCWPLNLK